MRRWINKDQQTQFNLASQRALQNTTQAQKKQILQLAHKRLIYHIVRDISWIKPYV